MQNKTRIVMALFLIAAGVPSAAQPAIEDSLRAMMGNVNAQLAANGANIRVEIAEYITASDSIGKTVFFSDVGNKQLSAHFVPGDARRAAWSGPAGPVDDITWTSDQVQGNAGPGLATTQTAISNAMATLQGQVCSTIPLTGVITVGNIGTIENLLAPPGGSRRIVADVVHAGFANYSFLPPTVIAATFTWIFASGSSIPTDIDNNGKLDVAFRETYYNTANFSWGIDAVLPLVDVETVALHEAGHGLSQGHFGTLLRTDANGKFHFAPRAVMNAGYSGAQQEFTMTDTAGHCSIWASWPQQ